MAQFQNPFLRGMLGSQQQAQQQQLGQLQAMGMLSSLQDRAMQQQAQQQQAQELQALIPQLTDPAAQLMARSGDIKGAIGRQFPQQKLMTVGDSLVDATPGRDPRSVFQAQPKPQLTEIGVEGQPGVRQRAWASPGQAPIPVGGAMAPDILNPDVQAARMRIAQAGKSNVVTNVLPPQKTFENEDKLRADYSNNPLVKASSEMQNAFNLIDAAYKRPSAANDLAMATKYMKILDPTSVVRESEFALAVNATGLLDKVQNYSAALLEGKKLNPNQRKDFYESAKAINDAFQSQRKDVDSQFSEMATGYGLNPKNVIPALRGTKSGDRRTGGVPQGVDPKIWEAMTEQERALWRN